MASTMDKVKAEIKHVLHKDGSNTNTVGNTNTTGTTHHNHTATGTAGGINNGVPEGTAGPHNSRIANAADPRVDSDLDSSRHTNAGYTGTNGGYNSTSAGVGAGAGAGNGVHGHGTTHNNTGAYGTTGGATTATAGPHSSNLLNKADPRVDSDADGSRNFGAAQYGPGGANTGNSNTLSGNSGFVTGSGTGATGGISHSTNAGPHDSNVANKLDPRVDSDLDGRGNRTGAHNGGILGASGSHATPGSGTAQNTAGPHNSDMANKIDPRVDSDLSGGKTYGGNATHA